MSIAVDIRRKETIFVLDIISNVGVWAMSITGGTFISVKPLEWYTYIYIILKTLPINHCIMICQVLLLVAHICINGKSQFSSTIFALGKYCLFILIYYWHLHHICIHSYMYIYKYYLTFAAATNGVLYKHNTTRHEKRKTFCPSNLSLEWCEPDLYVAMFAYTYIVYVQISYG